MPISENESYTIFRLKGRDAAAAYTIRPDQKAEGVPPNWLLYVAVESADETAKRVASLGGKVLAEPFDVMDLGRMAVLQDPTGAVVAIWEAKKHAGTLITQEKGTLCWADLSTPDPDKAAKFYSELFGWTLEKGQDDFSGYLHIKNGENYIGGVQPVQYRNPNAPPHWLPYFEIANCDTTTATARQLGANAYVDPTTMENVGRWSVLADPQGAVFAAFQAIPHEQQVVKAS